MFIGTVVFYRLSGFKSPEREPRKSRYSCKGCSVRATDTYIDSRTDEGHCYYRQYKESNISRNNDSQRGHPPVVVLASFSPFVVLL